jgi:hypothetical protein
MVQRQHAQDRIEARIPKRQRLRPTLHGRSRSLAALSNHSERRLNRNHIKIIWLIGTGARPDVDYRSAPIEGGAERLSNAGIRASLR